MVIIEIKMRIKGSIEPNIRILKNYAITFDENYLTLYDLKGNKLHTYNFFYNIKNICTINTKFLLLITKRKIISLIIEKENVKIKEIKEITSKGEFLDKCLTSIPYYSYELDSLIDNDSKTKKESLIFFSLEVYLEELNYKKDNIIFDSFYSKTNNLLFVSYGREIIIIKIDPINLLIQKRIQTIYIDRVDSCSLLEINKNLFLVYDKDSIFLYQKINGIKTYELRAKLALIFEYYIHLNNITYY